MPKRAGRGDFFAASSMVWKLCKVNKIEGCISTLSVPNIVYILRKELTSEKTQQLIGQITMIFKVVDLKSANLTNAAEMYSSDYEDAVQMCQAKRIKADFIIIRSIKDFRDSKISALKPDEFLERCEL